MNERAIRETYMKGEARKNWQAGLHHYGAGGLGRPSDPEIGKAQDAEIEARSAAFFGAVTPEEQATADALDDAQIRAWLAAPTAPNWLTPAEVTANERLRILCARWTMKGQG